LGFEASPIFFCPPGRSSTCGRRPKTRDWRRAGQTPGNGLRPAFVSPKASSERRGPLLNRAASDSHGESAASATERKPPPSAAEFRFDGIVSSGPASRGLTRARFPRLGGLARGAARCASRHESKSPAGENRRKEGTRRRGLAVIQALVSGLQPGPAFRSPGWLRNGVGLRHDPEGSTRSSSAGRRGSHQFQRHAMIVTQPTRVRKPVGAGLQDQTRGGRFVPHTTITILPWACPSPW
jgi:hypothetical protein